MILCTVHRYGVLCFNELVAYSKPTHRSTLCMIMIVHSPDVAFLLLSPRVIYAAAFTYQLNECPALLICSKATICQTNLFYLVRDLQYPDSYPLLFGGIQTLEQILTDEFECQYQDRGYHDLMVNAVIREFGTLLQGRGLQCIQGNEDIPPQNGWIVRNEFRL